MSCAPKAADAVAELNRAATGSDLLKVADAYAELGEVAGALAQAVTREDRTSGLRHKRAQGAA
jgi:hypothetical protein